MDIHFNNAHGPEELRIISAALALIADVREKRVAEVTEHIAALRATAVGEAPAKKPKAAKAEPAPTPPAAEPAPQEAAPSEPAAASPSKAPTLEEVRARFAELSQAGKAAEVKALLKKFGAAKLTDVPSEKYDELLAAAEGI